MKKAKTFYERLFNEIKPALVIPKRTKHRKILTERLTANLLGERAPDDHLPITKRSPRQVYIHSVFKEYFEIQNSLERMELTKIYISRIPSHVSKFQYVRYHYEYYLNELYIYNLRVNHLFDFIIKKCRKLGLDDDIPKVKNLKEVLNRSMKGYINVRGRHVHVARYESNKLSQLFSLDLLSKDFDFIRNLRDWELKLLRRHIKSEIEKTHKTLKSFLEEGVYRHLGQLIFTKLKLAHRGQAR